MGPPLRAVAALVGALVLAGCGGSDGPPADVTPATPVAGVVEMRAYEWGFEPAAVRVPVEEELRIVLRNDGEVLHDLKIEELEAEGIESASSGPLEADEGELFVGVEEGEEGTLSFIPLETGTFTYYCTIQGHRTLGMEGTLTIE